MITKKILLSLILLLAIPMPTFGAELLVSWRANAFVPSSYSGKIFPGLGSTVTATVNLVDKGKIVSLASRDVRWFLNRKLLNSGVGKTTVEFTRDPLSLNNTNAELKIFLNYNGENMERFVTIPFQKPEVVIHANSPNNAIAPGTHALRALLYYWNIGQARDVRMAWTINGEPAGSEGDLSNVQLDLPSFTKPTPLTLSLTVRNAQNDFEFAQNSLNLTIR